MSSYDKKRECVAWCLAAALLPLLCGLSFADGWSVSAGPSVRGVRVRASGSSYARDSALLPEPSSYSEVRRQMVGMRPPGEFDDGSVWDTVGSEDTMNWSYQNPSQYDAARGLLLFHRTEGHSEGWWIDETTSAVTEDRAVSSTEEAYAPGARVLLRREAGKDIGFWHMRAVVGIEGAWGFESHQEDTPYRATSTRRHTEGVTRVSAPFEFGFALGGNVPPPAPYANDPDHGGFAISSAPATRQQLAAWQTETTTRKEAVSSLFGTDRVEFDTTADLYELTVGAELYGRESRRVALSLMPYLCLGVAEFRVARQEDWTVVNESGQTVSQQTWNDRERELDVTVGAGLEIGVRVPISDSGWFLDASGGYRWYAVPAHVHVGPNTVEFDPSGLVAALGVGRAL
jgi:hypothetical protein